MKKPQRYCAVLLLGLCAACTKGGDTPSASTLAGGALLATVNGSTITAGELELLRELAPPHLQAQLTTPAGRHRVAQDLIDRELLYAESVKRGLDHDPKVLAGIDMNRRILIATKLLQTEIRKAAQQYYDAHAAEFEQLALSHLFITFGEQRGPMKGPKPVRTEKEAVTLINALKARILKGETFADVAREYSEDRASKEEGGALGRVRRNESRLIRRGYGALLETAFGLTPETIAGPVKSPEGYHLLFVTAPPQPAPFDEVAGEIEFRVRSDVRSALLEGLRKEASITRYGELAEEAPAKTPPHDLGTTGQAPHARPLPQAPVRPTHEAPPEAPAKGTP
ncbi:MAG: peptidylprolyl isomerase [Deltaproteobacteria bacterium]|nr:peptidylprolyl isomerase [Deltaproteobacteria bacterium]